MKTMWGQAHAELECKGKHKPRGCGSAPKGPEQKGQGGSQVRAIQMFPEGCRSCATHNAYATASSITERHVCICTLQDCEQCRCHVQSWNHTVQTTTVFDRKNIVCARLETQIMITMSTEDIYLDLLSAGNLMHLEFSQG